jgi:hypothetical protein
MEAEDLLKVRVYTVCYNRVLSGAEVRRSGSSWWVLDLDAPKRYAVVLLEDPGGERALVRAVKMVYKQPYENPNRTELGWLEEISKFEVGDGALLVIYDGWRQKAVKPLYPGRSVVVSYFGDPWKYTNRGGVVRAARCDCEPWSVDVRV